MKGSYYYENMNKNIKKNYRTEIRVRNRTSALTKGGWGGVEGKGRQEEGSKRKAIFTGPGRGED